MKLAAFALLAATLMSPFSAMSCMSDGNTLIQNIRYYPIVGDGTDHWPTESNTVIGSITSYLVPIHAKVELKHIKQGSLAPLTIFDEQSHEQMRSSRYLVPRWVDISYDSTKFRWVHIYASSYGVSEVHISVPNSWSKTMKLTMVYPSPADKLMPEPVALTLGATEMQTAAVDAHDNIEVTVPGSVADGWTASPVSETGFNLIRIQQVQKTDGEPQVRLFFAGTSSPKNATVVLRRRSGPGAKKTEFRVRAMPTPTC